MAKDDAKQHRRGKQDPPATIGELRKLLKKRGNPWQPDPRLSDDEPIPKFPTGSDGTTDPVGSVLPEGSVIDFISKEPPSNPFLRETWKERGLREKSDTPKEPGTNPEGPRGTG